MHAKLEELVGVLNALSERIQEVMTDDRPVTVRDGSWFVPGVSRVDLLRIVSALINSIKSHGKDDLGDDVEPLNELIRRVEFLVKNTAAQLWNGGHAWQAIYGVMVTLEVIRTGVAPYLEPLDAARAVAELKALKTRLRAMEGTLNAVEPDMGALSNHVAAIKEAHETALALPADLDTLSRSRKTIAGHLKGSAGDAETLATLRGEMATMRELLNERAVAAADVLQRCEAALSSSTSVGLGAAFSERSKALDQSMYFWVVGLLLSLVVGGMYGASRLESLQMALAGGPANASSVVLSLLLSVVSLGGAVWFAWVATKQIGQRFRLSEDYAFKASISRAYEGYRAQAHQIDAALEARLLSSALTRLDELPLRLVETESHGSPWHEMLSSDVIKKAMSAVPDFAAQVKDLARSRLAVVAPVPKVVSEVVATADKAP